MFSKAQSQTAVLDFNIDTVYQAAISAVNSVSRMKVGSTNPSKHTIRVDIPMSAFSWGETMTISMREVSQSSTEISFTSDSNLGLEFAAKSKNRKNIDRVIAAMSPFLH